MNADPLIGQEIDGYRILEELGRGGMGVVYKAEEVALARTVAIKMIARGLAGEEAFAQKFLREARSLARVSSLNITGIYTLRSTEVGLFIVMEYVGGGNLRDRLEGGPMSWAEAKPLVLQTLAALHDAHSVGVIHRDIKPGNIMLTERGMVKVTDFGLAKLYEADPTATVTRAISGTLHYMSPEQVQGAQDLDGRTDLYALGVTIYEMLSGRLPFETGGGEFATMRTIVEEEYAPLSKFAKRLPKGLEAAVTRSVAKAPEHRFADADEMRAAFEAIPTDKAPAPKPKKKPKKKAKAKEKPIAEDRPAVKKETPAAIKALQAALKEIPELFKKKPAATGAVTEDGTVVEGEAYIPVKPPRKPLPIRPLLYVFGGGLALAAFALLMWWLLPFFSGSSAALSIDSDPQGAAVSLNGERLGVTPLELSSVDLASLDSLSQDAEGARLRVSNAGYVTTDTFITLSGEPRTVSIVLRREQVAGRPAAFVIASSLPGADVFINGQPRGRTPLGLDDAGDGPISVTVQRQGYQTWSRQGVMPGQMDTLFAELLPVVIPGETRPPIEDRPIVVEPPPDRPPVIEPPPNPPPVDDPPPDTPACDRAALTRELARYNQSCPQYDNELARNQCFARRDQIQAALDRCTQ